MATFLDKIQTLPIDQQTRIMEQLQAKFPQSTELEAYTYLLIWVEMQQWHLAIDSNIQDHVLRAKVLMDAAIDQLQVLEKNLQSSPGNFQGMMNAPKIRGMYMMLQEVYGDNPIGFTKSFHEIYSCMKVLVEQFTNKNAANSTINQEDADMMEEEEETVDSRIAIRKELQGLSVEHQRNENLMKNIEQAKEQYVIMFQEKSSEIGQLESFKTEILKKSTINEKEKEKKITEVNNRITQLQSELSIKGTDLSMRMRVELVEYLTQHLQHIEEVQKTIVYEIGQWTYGYQKALSGWPQPQSLDTLQPLCEKHSELLWRLYQHIQKMDNMFRPALQRNEQELKKMDLLKTKSHGLLSNFLNRCFVIEKHAPQVLKTTTKFGATLRHLIGGKLNAHIHPPEVTCTLVSEKYVQKLYKSKGKMGEKPGNEKYILNNRKAMEYSQKHNAFNVEFKNLSLTRANRQGGKKEESVCEEKRSLLFFTELVLGQEKFAIMTLSVPSVVTVHGNQFPDAEATIMWDDAFAEQDRIPYKVKDSVTWPELAEALNYKWTQWNGRELTEDNLAYIGSKLFPGRQTKEELANCEVTWQMLNKDHLDGRQFTFWRWFYGIMDVVKKNMLYEWRDGYIQGFISKQQAQQQLIAKQFGTFLLRFSDGELGGVSVAYTAQTELGEKQVWNLCPWTTQHLQMRRFADRLKDLESLVILDPDIMKDVAFGRYYTEDRKAIPQDPLEYRETELALKVKGDDGSGTPVGHSPFHQGSIVQGQMDMFPGYGGDPGACGGYPGSPAESFASTMLDGDFSVGGEEIVGDLTTDGGAMNMISNVTAALMDMAQADAAYSGYNRGGPQDFMSMFDSQCSLGSLADSPGPESNVKLE